MIETQTYKAVQAVAPGKLELTEKPLTEPGPGYVRFACKRAASVIRTLRQSTAYSPSNGQGCRATRPSGC
jgi:hypothetical protein